MGTYPSREGLDRLKATIQALHDWLFHAPARSTSCTCIDLSSALLQRRPRTTNLATAHGTNLTARPGQCYGSEEVPKVDGVVRNRGWLDSPCPLMERIRGRHPFVSVFILAQGWLCKHRKEGLRNNGGKRINERRPGPARLCSGAPMQARSCSAHLGCRFPSRFLLVFRLPKRPAKKQ